MIKFVCSDNKKKVNLASFKTQKYSSNMEIYKKLSY